MKAAKNIYRQFVEFEEKAAAIYVRLASRFSREQPDLSGLWLQMAMEEKQHAGLLQFCLAEKMFAPSLPEEPVIRKANDLLRSLEKRSADPEIEVAEAFAIALELESSEVNTIYCHMTTPLHGSQYLLRRKIASSPPDHLSRLATAARRFGVPQEMEAAFERLARKSEDAQCG